MKPTDHKSKAQPSAPTPSAPTPSAPKPSRSLWAVAGLLAVVVAALLLWPRETDVPGLPAVKLDNISITASRKATIAAAIGEIRARPGDANTWGRLGCLLRQLEMQEASACIAQAERLAPNEPMWPYLRGLDLTGVDNDAALEGLNRAADLDREFSATRVKLASLLIDMNRLDQAEQALRAALEIEPTNAWAQQEMGRLLYRQSKFAESLAWVKRSLESNPRQFVTHELLAQVYHRLGQRDEAAKHQQIVESFPEPRTGWFEPLLDRSITLLEEKGWYHQEAEELLSQGDFAQAEMKFKEDLLNLPDDTLASVHYAVTLVKKQDYAAAGSVLDSAIARQANSAELHFNRGVVFYYQRDYGPAETHFRKAIALKPTYSNAHANLGHVLQAMNDVDGAIAEFREALRYRAESWEAHLNLGILFTKRNDRDAAIDHLSAALRLLPKDHAARPLVEQHLKAAEAIDKL